MTLRVGMTLKVYKVPLPKHHKMSGKGIVLKVQTYSNKEDEKGDIGTKSGDSDRGFFSREHGSGLGTCVLSGGEVMAVSPSWQFPRS